MADDDKDRTYTKAEADELIAQRIEQVRQEEKDKLYGAKSNQDDKFKALQTELRELQKAQTSREREQAKLAKAREDAEKRAQETELSAKELLQKREQEWQEQQQAITHQWEEKFTGITQQLENERAVREKEAELARISSYIQRRSAEEQDTIEPHLHKYITGNTPEEVELSIKQLQEDSAGIFQSSEQHFRGARAAMPGSAPTGNTPTGPLETNDLQPGQLTAEDIKNIPISEWRETRKKLGIGGTGQQGLFG